MAEVRLAGVGKSYGKHAVIADLDLTVQDGECFTLLGPSGCGKTVILRLISGFEPPSAGSISIGGRVVSTPQDSLPPEARRIGVVFQDYAVWPHMTVLENVLYPLKIRQVERGEAAERASRAVAAVNLAGYEARLPFQLSGGQQQRVALARALVADPEVLLLDEPLCNLDANLREEMRFEIKELQRQTGVTILYVTHDQEIALAISDRMAIMDRQGTIRQVGSPEDIFERPADGYVFQFMGVTNFIPVWQNDGDLCVKGSGLVLGPAGQCGSLREPVAGCRPTDVAVCRDGTTAGVVRRRNYLGSIIDYRIGVGDVEVRAQVDTREALEVGLLFEEGEPCGLRFHDVRWFEASDARMERVEPMAAKEAGA